MLVWTDENLDWNLASAHSTGARRPAVWERTGVVGCDVTTLRAIGPGVSAIPWTPYDTLIIAVTVLVPSAMVGLLLLMMRSLRRQQVLQRGLVHIVFLPEKRRRFLATLTGLGSFFVASGAIDALTGVGLLTGNLATVLSTVSFVGGAVALFALIWTALRPGNLTAEQKAGLAWIPPQYYPLALAPFPSSE